MRRLKADGVPLFLCSAGDFYGGGDEYNEPKSHFLARMMSYFGYDAIAVGDLELSFGLKKLVTDRDEYGLNLLCANLFWKKGRGTGKRVFPAYRIVAKGGVKVGFLAVLSPRTKVKKGKVNRVEALTYIIEDPLGTARELLPKLRKKCDLVVLLAHMRRNELDGFLARIPPVDLVVMGHSEKSTFTEEPYLIAGIPVYQATAQGQNIGYLKMTLDGEGKISDRLNKVFRLDKTYPDDEKVAAIVSEFEEENRKIQKELYARRQLGKGPGTLLGETYLGLGICIRCHQDEFEAYTKTAHAHAYTSLSGRYMHRDSNCIPCHSTGYGEPGGFTGRREVGSPVDLVDVQCEACHGPGSEHVRDGSYARKGFAECGRCHTEEQDPDFDLHEDWARIAH